jgi:hypothetical protein
MRGSSPLSAAASKIALNNDRALAPARPPSSYENNFRALCPVQRSVRYENFTYLIAPPIVLTMDQVPQGIL